MSKVQRSMMIAGALVQTLLFVGLGSAAAGQGTATAAAKSPNDSRPVLVCFGDSLTAGAGTDPGQSYPDYLQKDLDQAHYRYRVVNKGVSGNTSKDGVNRLNEVLRLHPAIVVVEFGGNDGLRGLPISQSRANLDRIVGTLHQAGVPVALAGITLPPQYGEDYIKQFNETYVSLARKYHAPMIPFLLQGAYGGKGTMQADGIHATAKGNEVVARNVLNLLKPLLKNDRRASYAKQGSHLTTEYEGGFLPCERVGILDC